MRTATAFLLTLLFAGCAGISSVPKDVDPFHVIVTNEEGAEIHQKPRTAFTDLLATAPYQDTLRVTGVANLKLFYRVVTDSITGYVDRDDVVDPVKEAARIKEKAAQVKQEKLSLAKATYDRFEDHTFYTIKRGIPLNSLAAAFLLEHDIDLVAETTCPGRTECHPDWIRLRLRSRSVGWTFLDSHRVIILVDNQRIVPESSHSGDVLQGGEVYETVSFYVAFPAFQKVANARSFEMRVGAYEFDLSHDERESLRSLAYMLNQNLSAD